ncbi:hypothetical protein DNH61_05815 [Paenibacillus sambharensis]|uniref:Major facilitator superfamily (MFS) profile domain-containing protein n=1 Tax=Paenibacillus sambharensis TaxID=1803190 RepID=A0A2W1LD28_9BACL|nr:MFS transporter [Paenibacillus sambharensis]PZD96713.1 hypothetical protein DNH61_05815 [Paenibacillus sambharensis]
MFTIIMGTKILDQLHGEAGLLVLRSVSEQLGVESRMRPAARISPIAGAQIAMSYPPEQRGKMLGLIGMVFGLGTILGPIAGGLIIAHMDWRSWASESALL